LLGVGRVLIFWGKVILRGNGGPLGRRYTGVEWGGAFILAREFLIVGG
jgi:hypothetical protein